MASTTSETPANAPEEPRDDELQKLGLAFKRVFKGLNRARGRDTHLGGDELSQAQFELLIELHNRGELPAGELAAAAQLTPSTVTQMLEHLAACGHVERVRSETDKRIVVTRLTDEGARKIEAKRAAWKERWDTALEGVGERDIRAATRVLERLAEMVEETYPGARQERSEGVPKGRS
jgi:MarR family transcriptional regulator, organic hydroperoxide resistance regulator